MKPTFIPILTPSFLDAVGTLTHQETQTILEKVRLMAEYPDHPSFKWHRLDRIGDGNMWSGYVNKDLRIIAVKYKGVWVLLYVDHHDEAYKWAQSHKVEESEVTGELVVYKVAKQPAVRTYTPYLKNCDKNYLLALGVPPSYIDVLCLAETEQQFLDALSGLPEFLQERLLDVATGKLVPPPPRLNTLEDLWDHLPARQYLGVLKNIDELRAALHYPWERWLVFLHPSQREAVERVYKGPFLLTGAAGTGKTVVVLHRTKAILERYPDQPVLLTTFNKALSFYLQKGLAMLLQDVPTNLTLENLHSLALRWYSQIYGRVEPLSEQMVRQRVQAAGSHLPYDADFLFAEFQMWDAFGLYRWEDYRDFTRLGRKVPLSGRERLKLHEVFHQAMESWEAEGQVTFSRMLHRVREAVEAGYIERFRSVIADEVQDFGPAELMLLRALAVDGPDSLFLAMDSAQRIYQFEFPWSALGIEVKGRSLHLKVNYRLTREIAHFASRLVDREGELGDVVALLRGPEPRVVGRQNIQEALEELEKWLGWLHEQGYPWESLAVLVRTKERLNEVKGFLEQRLPVRSSQEEREGVYLGTVHSAKGQEFRAVAVFGANDTDFPLQSVLSKLRNEEAKEEFLRKERSLLYVACSRAREQLLILYWGTASGFLDRGLPGQGKEA